MPSASRRAAGAQPAAATPSSSPSKADHVKVVAAIVAKPTASDALIAAEVNLDRAFVMDVRSQMGAKHTWPKPKESN
jgi:hypothetical protein